LHTVNIPLEATVWMATPTIAAPRTFASENVTVEARATRRIRVTLYSRIEGMPETEGSMQAVDAILKTPLDMAKEFEMDVPTLMTVYVLTVVVCLRIRRGLGRSDW
jgi:hypothetical protein